MTDKDKKSKTALSRLMAFTFLIALTGLVIFNVKSTVQLSDLNQKQKLKRLELQQEKNLASQLISFEAKFKTIESEFEMMEQGLKKHYRRHTQLQDFVPVFDDQIVAYGTRRILPKKVRFYVPTGNHRVKIEAVKNSYGNRGSGIPSDDLVYSESFTLESESNHVVTFRRSKRTARKGIRVCLDDQDGAPIEFPFPSSGLTLGVKNGRTVVSPNQIEESVLGGIQRSEIFRMMVFGEKPNIGTNLESEILTVRLFIESDGPMTSLPDDPPVVRMLLKNIDAGKKPRFTFNPEGWYEFEDRNL